VIGIREVDGAFADHVVVPAANAHRLPEDLDVRAGALVEPLAAAIRTFEITPLSPGDHVVVLGAGRLGLLEVSTARSFGAHVTAVSRSAEKRERALRFGATEAVAGGAAARERVLELTGGVGADVVVECTGAPEGLAEAISLVRPRGTIAQKSTAGQPARGFDPTLLAVHELTIQGTRCGPFGKAIERLKAGLLPVDDYVAAEFPLEEIEAAFRVAGDGRKVLIQFDAS
jgi:alcohol dehydrogenase